MRKKDMGKVVRGECEKEEHKATENKGATGMCT
jgi:hypothetical protein